MCGRYAFFSPAESVKRTFALDFKPELVPRYNIAPTQSVPALRVGEEGSRTLVMLHWGLVPRWAKERAIGNRMINARSETLAEKPAYRDAFRRRRCLILADGWYEWQAAPGGKQPWFVRLRDPRPITFAGLWERWKEPAGGELLESCTIVTTDASESIRRIHERMPVVLPEPAWDRWMDPAYSDTETLSEILRPYDAKALKAWQVSRLVNTPKNEGPKLIEAEGSGAVVGA
ncbi:MAG: SOS response-associated peptidase [Gammaproteobacteria bacterium]|nr:SOS response-associated peptidase [Gammaproteobacteria bacterium]